jgi:hypothetical protein
MNRRIALSIIQGLYYPAALGAVFASVVIQISALSFLNVLVHPRTGLSIMGIWYFTLSFLATIQHQNDYDLVYFLSDIIETIVILCAFSYLGWFSSPNSYIIKFNKACFTLAFVPILHIIWNAWYLVKNKHINWHLFLWNILLIIIFGIAFFYCGSDGSWWIAIALGAINLWITIHKTSQGKFGPNT